VQKGNCAQGKEYPAKLLSAEEARKIYERHVRRNEDPALVEWIGRGMFKTSVFPVPLGD
jgi:Ca-activated chloride channel family protein